MMNRIQDLIRYEIGRALRSQDVAGAESGLARSNAELMPHSIGPLTFMRRISYNYNENWSDPTSESELTSPRLTKIMFLKNMPYEYNLNSVSHDLVPVISGTMSISPVLQYDHHCYSINLFSESSRTNRLRLMWTGVITVYLNDEVIISSNYLERTVNTVLDLPLDKGGNQLDILIYNQGDDKSFEADIDFSGISSWSIPSTLSRSQEGTEEYLGLDSDVWADIISVDTGFMVRSAQAILEGVYNPITGYWLEEREYAEVRVKHESDNPSLPIVPADATTNHGFIIQARRLSGTDSLNLYIKWIAVGSKE